MYCILIYDCEAKKTGKMLKLCRKYLNWIQNSVFEGEISDLGLKQLTHDIKKIIDDKTDSIIIFSSRNSKWLDKKIIGLDKNPLGQFL